MALRVVFDTNTVLSALLFANGQLAWLREHWRSGECVPLLCRETAAELNRVLAYPKFRLTEQDRLELLGEYLPFCTIVECGAVCDIVCRDHGDQIFLNLASDGLADAVVTGDRDLLELSGKCRFVIETPALYQRRFAE